MSDTNLAALVARIDRLDARAAILDCMNRYTRGADRLDRELLLSAYHPDATDDRGAFTGGPEARVDWLLAFLRTLGHTSHHISNFTIKIDGDVAHTESYVMTTRMPTGGGVVTIGGARYIDRFEQRDGDWRIAHREAVMDYEFTGPTSALPAKVLSGMRDRSDRSYARPLLLSPEGEERLRANLTSPR